MEPTLSHADVVLVDRRAYRQAGPAEGDVVVASHPRRSGLRIVKRIEFVDEHGRCYLSSDNRSEPSAEDSRSFGVVTPENIQGRVTSALRR